MVRGSGIFIKYGVAARGFYMFLNFVNVLLVVEYDGGVAFVNRKESKLGSLFHQGLQSSTLLCIDQCRWGNIFDHNSISWNGYWLLNLFIISGPLYVKENIMSSSLR